MRNEYFFPVSRRLDIEYPSGIRHDIINCFTPIDDGHIQLCQWLFRNDSEEVCPESMLIHFDEVFTREDTEILESTDPDGFVDVRRRGVEYSMESDKPGMLIRKHLMMLLSEYGKKKFIVAYRLNKNVTRKVRPAQCKLSKVAKSRATIIFDVPVLVQIVI